MSGFGESGRVASLDALRGGAAFAVAIAHYLAYRGIGPFRAEAASALAVEIFFTLSGFVLAPQVQLSRSVQTNALGSSDLYPLGRPGLAKQARKRRLGSAPRTRRSRHGKHD